MMDKCSAKTKINSRNVVKDLTRGIKINGEKRVIFLTEVPYLELFNLLIKKVNYVSKAASNTKT